MIKRLLIASLLFTNQAIAEITTPLPDLGNNSIIERMKERELGQKFMQSLRSQVDIITDPLIADYINTIGQRLARFAPNQFKYTFFVVDIPTINAFAAPGGYIAIHSGLFLKTETESELAAVLAHEISHVSQQHLRRAIEATKQTAIPTAAAILAALALGAVSPDLAAGAATAAIATNVDRYMHFSRLHEQEADRIGISLLYKADYDPSSMALFFERLLQQSRFYGDFPEFLSTHPVTQSRIADTLNRARKMDPKKYRKNNELFLLIKARLQVLTDTDSAKLIREFRRSLKQSPKAIDKQYGLALALLANNQTPIAINELEGLYKASPEDPVFTITLAEAYQKNKQPKLGIQILTEAYEINPEDLTLCLSLANMLLKNKKAIQAIQLLRAYSKDYNNNLAIKSLLYQAYGRTGQLVNAYITKADIFYEQGLLPQAITQLTMAKHHHDITPQQRAIVKAKLEKYQREYKPTRKLEANP